MYTRRAYRPRSTYRRRSYRKRAMPPRRPMKRMIQNVINSNLEKKHFDFPIQTTISNAAAIYKLTSIPQGDTDQSRDGDKAKMLSLKLKANIAAADTINFFRVILFQWHTNDTNTPPSTQSILQTADVNSPLNHDAGAIYSVFHDKVYALSANGDTNRVLDFVYRFGKKTGKMKWVKSIIKYDPGIGPTTSIDSLFILLITDSNVTPHPSFNGIFRTTYTDA